MARSTRDIAHSQKGFSISELLVTSAILVLVSAIMAAGIPAALRAYMGVVDASNAQILLATTSTRLRDELGVASSIKETGSQVVFESLETGCETTIRNGGVKSSDNTTVIDGISLTQSVEDTEGKKKIVTVPLVPQSKNNAAKTTLHTEFESIDYDEDSGIFTVRNLKVLDGNGKEIAGARFDELKIRALAAPRS